jgi:YD repeat-containing protein
MTMTYDPASRIVTMLQGAAATSYTFDANGNKVLDNLGGVQTGYVFEKENRLTKVTHSDGSISSYTYSGDGLRRTRQEPTDSAPHTIVWDGSD